MKSWRKPKQRIRFNDLQINAFYLADRIKKNRRPCQTEKKEI